MKKLIAAIGMTLLLATLASAAGTSIEQKKTDQLKRVDDRIAHLQEERACIQAAATQEALRACHDKFKSEIAADKASRKK